MLLYKYRSLSNLQFVLDIIVNKRMFAAPFDQLNDPMEGAYNYALPMSEKQRRNIYSEKSKCRLLSLTRKPNSMLMWTHYSESHAGIVLGVSVNHLTALGVDIQYVDDLNLELAVAGQNLDHDYSEIARKILSMKRRDWAYEEEYRIFVEKESYQTFVNVQIKEIVFGINTDKHKRELITKIARKFCPGVEIRKMRRPDLDIERPG